MENTDPKLIILLLLVIAGYFILQALNPHKKYSTQAFWETATVADVADIPEDALQPGNGNGPVLMWAATTTQDPAIIDALLARGVDINEVDGDFLGTPLSGAASHNNNTDVIDALVANGADLHARLLHDNSILQAAAMYNENPGIVTHLIQLGADVHHRNVYGQDVLDVAIDHDNQVAVTELRQWFPNAN
ncbi:ankyrin repeat domain-containing protein [Marinicella meishanensis]|uniref:ankyrin repeat domain-containing protein n=1 Tax=Marinicella meishanensis TaxID=2873263 RepID=UPI001CBFAE2B|nr:ankyrin repeat domain-containing protein [Marinicella sp. NBU2979]